MHGVMVPTTVNAEVASHQKPYEGTPFSITIDRIEPERLFSFRWHPGAIDPTIDYSAEPTTLIVFTPRRHSGWRALDGHRDGL